MIMYAFPDSESDRLAFGDGSGARRSPRRMADRDFGARFVEALERFGASVESMRSSTKESIRLADRSELLALLKSRHQVVPADLESAIRSQPPEALAFRLAGDPRMMRAVQLLTLSA